MMIDRQRSRNAARKKKQNVSLRKNAVVKRANRAITILN